MEGRRGSRIINFFNTPHRFGPRKFFTKTLMINALKKAAQSFNKEPISKPVSQPAAPTPEPEVPETDFGNPTPPVDTPKPTTVAGYTQGDEVTAVVAPKSCPHPKMLFISVPDCEGLAIT